MAYVVLATEVNGGNLLLQDCGAVEGAHLKLFAEIARRKGCDLMFEFGSPPDMLDVVKHAEADDKGVSSMPDMKRLWVLKVPADG